MKKIVNLILSNLWILLMYKLNKYSSIKESNVILDILSLYYVEM